MPITLVPPVSLLFPGLNDSGSSLDSFLGVDSSSVLVYRPTLNNGLNGILVKLADSGSSKYYVFSSAHGVIAGDSLDLVHDNIRLLILKLPDETLSASDGETVVELPWTRCIHNARVFLDKSASDVKKFSSDCCVFELNAELLSEAVKDRAVSVFDWRLDGSHKPSSKAVGVSLVLDPAQPPADQRYFEVRIEVRYSAWSGEYVYLPSEVAAKGMSGTGLTDKKRRLVSVISGNYVIGGKKMTVAVLAKKHLELLGRVGADFFENSGVASGGGVLGKRKELA